MATPKKNSITRHKQQNTKLTPKSQAFDIIPADQVQADATARPVITPPGPQQADNTLQTATQASSSQLTHQPPKIVPSGDTPSVAEPTPDLEEPSAPELTQTVPKEEPAVPGPSLSIKIPIAEDAESVAEPTPAPKLSEEVEAASAAKPGSDAEQPTAEHPEGSLEHALKEDTPKAQEHSDALKAELQTMSTDEEAKEPEHPHHELYGGKPVIAIHKPHGTKSALRLTLWLLLCLLLALATVDALLDAGIITLDYDIPYTDFL